MQRKKFLSMALLAVLILSSNGTQVEAESSIASDINEIENQEINKTMTSDFTWNNPRTKFNVFNNMNELYAAYGVDLVPESYKIEGIEPDYMEGKYLVFENINPLDIKIRYENVANYRGQDLDVLFTITNFTEGDQTVQRIKLGFDELRLKTDGYLNTEYEMKIVEHGNEQEVPVTFIMKIGDIDVDQYMGIKQFNEDYIGVSDDTNLSYSQFNDYFIFGNYPQQILDSYAPSNSIVYYDKSSVIQGVWGLDRTVSEPMNNVYTNFHIRLAPEPNTIINKKVSGNGEDQITQVGETLEYKIAVENTSDDVDALDVPVRDSLVENPPEYLQFNDDIQISDGLETTGNLETGDYYITNLPAKSTAVISYSMTLTSIPEGVEAITNIVTDNAHEPNICEEVDQTVDCDETITPIEPIINKPEIELPEIELPEIELPEIELPEIELPEIELPEIEVPCLDITCEDKVCSDNNEKENEKEVENETGSETIKNTSQQYHVNLCVAIIILLCGLLILRKYV